MSDTGKWLQRMVVLSNLFACKEFVRPISMSINTMLRIVKILSYNAIKLTILDTANLPRDNASKRQSFKEM